ncbi:MAG: matrixin family metalloprotease, partial [Lacunisphaera sp.]|nr:matrixin family metalloprotease [Lacunisphaera sp.]
MNAKPPGRFLCACALSLLLAVAGWGYVLITDSGGYVITWAPGVIPMQVKLATSPALSDDTSQSGSVVAAMSAWNTQLGVVRFLAQEQGPGTYGLGNDVNEIVMDSSIEGEAFGSNTLAVTVSFRSGNERIESDIIFNTAWTWDSYRGVLQAPEDIRRVAIHELGHVLGLNHPDQAGQFATAIMNSTVSSIDSLQNDDITGGRALYGYPGLVPANDNFANAEFMASLAFNKWVSGHSNASNIGATAEVGEPAHAGEPARRSVWWKWTAPASGSIYAMTETSNFDTVLGAYTGSTLSSLTEIASNDDANPGVIRTSYVAFNVTGGTTYYFSVDGWNGYFGSIRLFLEFTTVAIGAPVITMQPISRTVDQQVNPRFNITVVGQPAPNLRWQRLPAGGSTWADLPSGDIYSGISGGQLVINNPPVAMTGDQFRCIVSNVAGTLTSSAAVLTVNSVVTVITKQPRDAEIFPGGTVHFGMEFNGGGDVRWYRNGVLVMTDIGRTTNAFLTLANAAAGDAGSYHATFTCTQGIYAGVHTTSSAQLLVSASARPYIFEHPLRSPTGATPGGSGTVSVQASSSVTPTYQWRFQGVDIPGATSASYVVNNITVFTSGPYSVAVSNPYGTTLSADGYFIVNGPPEFSIHPAPQTVRSGTQVIFNAVAAGYPRLDYQWQFSPSGGGTWENVAESGTHGGVTTSQLAVNTSLALNGYAYRCVVGNFYGATASNPAILTVTDLPIISTQPSSQAVAVGSTIDLSVVINNATGVTYQWRKDGADIVGAVLSTYTIVSAQLGDAGDYSVVVTNSFGAVTSATATVMVTEPPVIRTPPASQAVYAGASASFSVMATSDAPLSYVWCKNGAPIGGATTAIYTMATTLMTDAADYSVVVTNVAGSVTSDPATLTVNPSAAPVITLHPVGQNVNSGLSASFTAAATGIPAPGYQWQRLPAGGGAWADVAGAGYSGATTATLTATSLTLANDGDRFRCIVTNVAGTVTSNTALLTVMELAPVAVAAGAAHSFALQADGLLLGFGGNSAGELGTGDTVPQNTPRPYERVLGFATSWNHSLFIKADGTLWGMGGNA